MISIIIPNYNNCQHIGKCINSIKVQTYRDWECIIVDDGSTDGSKKKISNSIFGDTRFTFISKTVNEGLSAARNDGMLWAKGGILFFVDSDDWIDRRCLETLMHEYRSHPDAGRVLSLCQGFDDKGFCWNYDIPAKGYRESTDPLLFSPQGDIGHSTGCLYIRENLPRFTFPNVRCFEDMIMNMGLVMAGSSIFITNKYHYHYLYREGSLVHSYQTGKQAQEERDALQKLIDKYNPPKEMQERFKAFLDNAIKGRTRDE